MQSLLTSAGDEAMMTTAQASMLNPSYCFSIRFRGDWTLDLMILGSSNNPTTPDRDTILDALDNVLDTYQRQKRLVSNDVLLLRYHWMDAVSDKVGTQAASLLYCLNGHTLTCASCSFPFLHPGYVPQKSCSRRSHRSSACCSSVVQSSPANARTAPHRNRSAAGLPSYW